LGICVTTGNEHIQRCISGGRGKGYTESEINKLYKENFSEVSLLQDELSKFTMGNVKSYVKKQINYNGLQDLLVEYCGKYNENQTPDQKLNILKEYYTKYLEILKTAQAEQAVNINSVTVVSPEQ
jgi:hypothetical protein